MRRAHPLGFHGSKRKERKRMSTTSTPGRPGDRLEIFSPAGAPARHGRIIEVLGGPGHEHYRVCWEDGRESIHYPSDGTRVVPAKRPAAET
jgi:hypothetical protein